MHRMHAGQLLRRQGGAQCARRRSRSIEDRRRATGRQLSAMRKAPQPLRPPARCTRHGRPTRQRQPCPACGRRSRPCSGRPADPWRRRPCPACGRRSRVSWPKPCRAGNAAAAASDGPGLVHASRQRMPQGSSHWRGVPASRVRCGLACSLLSHAVDSGLVPAAFAPAPWHACSARLDADVLQRSCLRCQ